MKAGTRVLVVEDDHSIARLLQMELQHRGLVVECVYDGSLAVAKVEEFRPDAVILDIMLPGVDGERLLRILRGTGMTAPVIMLTARDKPSDKIQIGRAHV